jgi:hypothetical protein
VPAAVALIFNQIFARDYGWLRVVSNGNGSANSRNRGGLDVGHRLLPSGVRVLALLHTVQRAGEGVADDAALRAERLHRRVGQRRREDRAGRRASLKNGEAYPATSGADQVLRWLGKFPIVLNILIFCSGAVSHFASSTAALGCLPWLGTVTYEPPQSPEPPGIVAMSHFPSVCPAFALM